MPKKVIIPPFCPVCKGTHFYKNGNCTACTQHQKRLEAQERRMKRPDYSVFAAAQNTRGEAFRKKEAKMMRGVWYT